MPSGRKHARASADLAGTLRPSPRPGSSFRGEMAPLFREFISKTYRNFVRGVCVCVSVCVRVALLFARAADSFQTTGLVRRCEPMIPVCVIHVTGKGNPYFHNIALTKKRCFIYLYIVSIYKKQPHTRWLENLLSKLILGNILFYSLINFTF